MHKSNAAEYKNDFRNQIFTKRMDWFFKPVLSSVLEDKLITSALLIFSVIQVFFATIGLPGWKCAIHAVTGFPCPGCGLSRAASHLLQGDVTRAMEMHVFAPILLLFVGVMILSIVLPRSGQKRLIAGIAAAEKSTGFSAMILFAMLFYWSFRVFNNI